MKNKLSPNGKWNDPTLTHARETVFGSGMRKEIRDTLFRAETMRDDQGLLDAADAKRQRKAQAALKRGT